MHFKEPGKEGIDLENRKDVDWYFDNEGTTQHSINEVPHGAEATTVKEGEQDSGEERPFQYSEEFPPF